MHRYIAQLNIERFQKLIATETDPAKRRRLQSLLADETAKLNDSDDASMPDATIGDRSPAGRHLNGRRTAGPNPT